MESGAVEGGTIHVQTRSQLSREHIGQSEDYFYRELGKPAGFGRGSDPILSFSGFRQIVATRCSHPFARRSARLDTKNGYWEMSCGVGQAVD